jgi:hypothetical protein
MLLTRLVGAWWADPLAGFVIVFYGLCESGGDLPSRAVRPMHPNRRSSSRWVSTRSSSPPRSV